VRADPAAIAAYLGEETPAYDGGPAGPALDTAVSA
jgi:hypothetical protein